MSSNKRKRAGSASTPQARKRPPAPEVNAREEDMSLYLEYRNARYANRGVVGNRTVLRPLTTCAFEVVARNLTRYLNDDYALPNFDLLPPNLLFQILDTARQQLPTTLTPELIKKVFLDRAPTSLDALVLDDLPSATHRLVWESLSRKPQQIDNLGGVGPGLRVLSINHLTIRSNVLCSALATMENLTSFDARGNVHLDDTVLTMLASTCPQLRRVNISMTAVSQVGIAKILGIKSMKVLKVASVKLAGDKFWMDFAAASEGSERATLTNLKIASNDVITDKGLTALIQAVGSKLETVDVNSTRISNLTAVLAPCLQTLQKLNISATKPRSVAVLHETISRLDNIGNLRKLSMQRSPKLQMNQTTVDHLSPLFRNLTHLRLANNPGITDMRAIIENAQNLEFLDVQNCGLTTRSFEAIEGIGYNMNLKALDVSGTRVDEGVGELLGRFSRLERVWLGNTRVTVTSCLNLREMDLNGCRGIPLRSRKSLFEGIWREVHGRG
ncbi:hypothetical protein HK097_008748 [Rhizophlyctis rosea]|uniref:RNI-like protein n=1 Tax=Rhizophlyctis rosea TaxID=64517 RepID=A0AAD5SCP1_9FUNG|nr:hypothetical protein HK097_008748 [Rhizophlyctis rosea]